MNTRKFVALALCSAMLGGGTAQALPAAPFAGTPSVTHTSDLYAVGYRGGYRHGGYRYSRGRNVGLGIAAAIVGGVVLSQAARSNGYYDRRYRTSGSSAAQRCADTYRSFDWDSGTYMGYDGERHVCPYLR
jgi:hypothetical protein